jgi:predicted lysophospholipase L1 biosynthesis ABC-type transport system permease subunit
VLLPLLMAVADLVSGQGLGMSVAAVAVAGLLVLAAGLAVRQDHRASPARVRTTLRERTLRTAFLPQRDPDAAGRPRPRAPGLEIAVR